MRALRIEKHGSMSELRVVDIDSRPLRDGEARIAVEAAGVNPSDVGSAQGAFTYATLPRILGRDFAGRVIEGPAEWMGAEVWGTGGDLGITRDGTHAEELVVPLEALARRPSRLSVEEAAAAGVPFVTAWLAFDEARLEANETVIVSGATGAVGAAAIAIAHARGARVIALVRDEASKTRLRNDDIAAVATKADLLDVVRSVTKGRGADVALNGIGASIFGALFDALADSGRMAIYSAITGREVTMDVFALYRRRLRVFGVSSAIDVALGARILDDLAPLFEAGKLAPHRAIERYALEDAPKAYARAVAGVGAKVVLVMRPRSSASSTSRASG